MVAMGVNYTLQTPDGTNVGKMSFPLDAIFSGDLPDVSNVLQEVVYLSVDK